MIFFNENKGIKGFTLIETLIAIIVLSVGVVAAIMGFPRGLQSLEDSEQLTQQGFYLYSTTERLMGLCEANRDTAHLMDFQAILGGNPRNAWNAVDDNFSLIITNRSADRTVDIEVLNNNNGVSVFGSLQY